MKSNNFNILLTHTSSHLNINNKNDVGNIDRVLNLIVENRQDQNRLREILENTSFKYLRRLQEDGLLTDEGGDNIVPISNPIVLEKALLLNKSGGYTALYKLQNKNGEPKKWIKWLSKWWWSFVVPLIVAVIILFITKIWFN